MAAEIFVTFGSISVLLLVIGIVLMVVSPIVGAIEDRKNEKAYKEWVERYGVSGRGSPSPPKQPQESMGLLQGIGRTVSDFIDGPECRRSCRNSNELARVALDNGGVGTAWELKRTIKNAEDHLDAGRKIVESKGWPFEVEADVRSRLDDLKSRLAVLEKEERRKNEAEARKNWEELEKRRKEDEARKRREREAEARGRSAVEETARREAEKRQLLLERVEVLRKQQASRKEQCPQKAHQADSLEPPEDSREFELYCADLLVKCGYDAARATKQSCDQGIDVIAVKDGVRYGIQCKRYSTDVGNKAVQEAHAGKTFYNCHVAVVMTNSGFTKAAAELANQLGVVLWDGKHLSKLAKSVAEAKRAAEKTVGLQKEKTAPAGGRSSAGNKDLVELAVDAGLEVIDKRDAGGCLWIIGGSDAERLFRAWGDAASSLTYKPGGGRATGGRDAWWVK